MQLYVNPEQDQQVSKPSTDPAVMYSQLPCAVPERCTHLRIEDLSELKPVPAKEQLSTHVNQLVAAPPTQDFRSITKPSKHTSLSLQEGWRGVASWYMDGNQVAEYARLRADFTSFDWEIDISKIWRCKHHTHPLAAGIRRETLLKLKEFLMVSHMRPYWEQMSKTQLLEGEQGSSLYYWAKDTDKSVRMDPRPSPDGATNMVVLVDSEYYIDSFTERLAYEAVPVIMVTEDVTAVSGSLPDAMFTFTRRGQITVKVNGGSVYTHMVNNWHREEFIARSGWNATVYHIERRSISPGKQIVFLLPVWTTSSIIKTMVAGAYLEALPLERIDPRVGEFTLLHVTTSTPEYPVGYFSIGRIGDFGNITVETTLHEACRSKCYESNQGIGSGQVKTLFDSVKKKIVPKEIALYCAYLMALKRSTMTKRTSLQAATSIPVIQSYTPARDDVQEAEPMVKGFGSPIINPGLTPTKNAAAVQQSIEGRIMKVASDKRITYDMLRHIEDFTAALFGNSEGRVRSVEFNTVFTNQPRATQQALLWKAFHGDYPMGEFLEKYSTFVKKEVYNGLKDPRPITITPPMTKLYYSAFMYAVTALIKAKKVRCYAFGLAPKKVAERLAKALQGATSAIMTDLSRWDGRVSEILRALERYIIRYLSATDELHDNLRAWRSSVGAKVAYYNDREDVALEYTTGYSRTSGSPETSTFNTLGNMFIGYLAIRIDHPQWSPEECVFYLLSKCMFGGDDGVMADISPEAFDEAARSVGAVATCKRVLAGHLGVEFLARLFSPMIMLGGLDATNSMCAPRRQLSKLLTSANLPPNVSPESKLHEKSSSFYDSDRNTPIMGQFVRTVMRISPKPPSVYTKGVAVQLANIRSYNTRYVPHDKQYPNTYETWMDDVIAQELPDFNWQDYISDLRAATSLTDLLHLRCYEPLELVQSTPEFEVDGEMTPPKPEVGVSETKIEPDASPPLDVSAREPGSPPPLGEPAQGACVTPPLVIPYPGPPDTQIDEVYQVPKPEILYSGSILGARPPPPSKPKPALVRGTNVNNRPERRAASLRPLVPPSVKSPDKPRSESASPKEILPNSINIPKQENSKRRKSPKTTNKPEVIGAPKKAALNKNVKVNVTSPAKPAPQRRSPPKKKSKAKKPTTRQLKAAGKRQDAKRHATKSRKATAPKGRPPNKK